MIKFVMCIHRRADLTREQFQEYWLEKHGPFFQKNAATVGSKRYVQSHTLETPLNDILRAARGTQVEFDGVAEVWFESEEALIAAMSSPEGQALVAALHEDELNFVDHARSSAFIVREEELPQPE